MFPYLPNTNVEESLDWWTDHLRTLNGTETRIQLREFPRRRWQASFGPFTETEWPSVSNDIRRRVMEEDYIPFWQYATLVTQAHSSGDNTLFFNTSQFPTWTGQKLAVIDAKTGLMEAVEVFELFDNRVTVATNLVNDYTAKAIVCPAMNGKIATNSITLNQITNTASLTFESYEEPQLQRETPTVTLDTLDGYVLFDERFLDGATEEHKFYEDRIDFGGAITNYSEEAYAVWKRSLNFVVNRFYSPEDMDLWWRFLDYCKGGQVPFLLCTNTHDVQFDTGTTDSTVVTKEDHPEIELDFVHGLKIFLEDGTTLIKKLTKTTDKTYSLDAAFNSGERAQISRISYLLKMRLGDTVTMSHGPLRTTIGLEAFATNIG